jgi:hypothetical protein
MELNEVLKDCQRSKIFILASIARDLPGKLGYIRKLYGNVEMGRLCK